MTFNAITNSPSSVIIAGDGWYPDLSVAEFQTMYRLPQEYAEPLVADHLELAMAWTQKQLADWRLEKEARGCADIHATGRFVGLTYRRAVFCHAKALLLGQFATVERREAARNDAKEGSETEAKFFAWAQNAVSDILNRPRVDVELL